MAANDDELLVAIERRLKIADRLVAIGEAHDDLIKFARLMFPSPRDPDDSSLSRYDVQLHHSIIAQALEAVEKGEILRLIITLPPRAGKSEIASKKFIPWLIGRDPYRHVIFATYNESFAEDTGKSVRDCMQMPVYNQIFPGVKLKAGSKASGRLETEEGGISVFAGVGGTITGRGADVFIIDDPIKDREEADSALERKKKWDWFSDVAKTRLMNDTSRIIIIMTRWHDDDIVGRLTEPENDCYREKEASKWKILQIPALAEENDTLGRKEGESLWPSKFSEEYLNDIKEANPRTFASLYQGHPNPEDGDLFRSEYFKTYNIDELPKNLRFYCASDHAVATNQEANYTCLLPVGVDEDDVIWVLPDVWWQRRNSLQVTEAMLDLMRRRKPQFWWGENGHISKSIGPFLRKRMMEEKVYCSIIEMTPSKDKGARAQSIIGRMSMGMVRFPKFAPWWERAQNEMLKFPSGKNDDFIDALSWVGIGLNIQTPAGKPREQPQEHAVGTIGWLLSQSKLDEQRRKMENVGF